MCGFISGVSIAFHFIYMSVFIPAPCCLVTITIFWNRVVLGLQLSFSIIHSYFLFHFSFRIFSIPVKNDIEILAPIPSVFYIFSYSTYFFIFLKYNWTLWNDHYDKSSYHLQLYKIIIITDSIFYAVHLIMFLFIL